MSRPRRKHLVAALTELMDDGRCGNSSRSSVGACFKNGRHELHDERGSYISCCVECFAWRALGSPPVSGVSCPT